MLLLVLRGTGYGVGWGDHTMGGGGGGAEPEAGNIYIYIYGYWVKSGPHATTFTAFINCTCMFEGYIYLPSTHIYQRNS